jgi:hypothetical protein
LTNKTEGKKERRKEGRKHILKYINKTMLVKMCCSFVEK